MEGFARGQPSDGRKNMGNCFLGEIRFDAKSVIQLRAMMDVMGVEFLEGKL